MAPKICGTSFGAQITHGALSMMILEDGPLFIADTHINTEPTPEQITLSVLGARHVQRFGETGQDYVLAHSLGTSRWDWRASESNFKTP